MTTDRARVTHISDCVKTDKPWGYEVLWADTDNYAAKIMCIHPNSRMSLQYHNKKEETIYVMKGNLKVWENENDEEFITLSPGNCYHVKPGMIHRFGAGEEIVTLTEVSTQHLNDVVRLKDDYSR